MARLKLLFYGLSGIILFSQCSSESEFKIEGNFSVADPTPVKLYLLTNNESILSDSCYVNNKDFELSGNIEYPGIYLMRFFNDQRIYLIIHPNDNIKVHIDNINNSIAYHIEDSPDSKLIKELTDNQNHVLRKVDQLSLDWEQSRADTTKRRLIDSTYHAILREHRSSTRKFIRNHPKSLANIMAVYQNFGHKAQPLFDPYDDHDLFNFIDSNLVALYPNTAAVQALNTEVTNIKAQIKQNKYIKKVVEQGRPIPPFKYANIQGDSIIINARPGKPVVLFFWATWNTFSTKELLALNEYYQKNGSRKVNVVAISLDSSEEELNKFIAENNISVPVVCDYLYWDSEIPARYAVKRIPSVIVANKEGIITAQDVFGPELLTQINY